MQWHVRDKIPYPTYTRRAQFYVDHEWFLEAGEAMPVHKANPKVGGDYPFRMTSGHMRWSVHSIWIVNKLIQRTHRGRPGMFMNPKDAKAKGLDDGELAEVFNDFNSFQVHIITSASVRPGQVIIYHAWEPYQFPGWKSYDAAIPAWSSTCTWRRVRTAAATGDVELAGRDRTARHRRHSEGGMKRSGPSRCLSAPPFGCIWASSRRSRSCSRRAC
jgi:anaerobic selenocysteine-containing dehydrogenase